MERFFADDGKIIHHRVFDAEPAMEKAAQLRSAGVTGYSENWHIASVPMEMVTMWLKEAGVSWDDHKARDEVLRKKLLDPDFAKFRVHEGTF